MYTHELNFITAGPKPADARGALIMLHGRGASAGSIVGLAGELQAADLAIYAPQANNHSWYPYSFMAPTQQNEPALSSAIETIGKLVDRVKLDGIADENIYFLGFSQGACLTLEYIARNAKRYGGAVAFTGGLIGEQLIVSNYKGDFQQTPVLVTTGDPDPHVPVSRVQQSIDVLKDLNAGVKSEVYAGRPHTILRRELELANEWVFKVK